MMSENDYAYTTVTTRSLPLSNKLIVACRNLGTIGDIDNFYSAPRYPHARVSNATGFSWVPPGDQIKAFFIKFVINGKEVTYNTPHSTIRPYMVSSSMRWAPVSDVPRWHPDGMVLSSKCFAPFDFPGYLEKVSIKNFEGDSFSLKIIVGSSSLKGKERQFSDDTFSCRINGFILTRGCDQLKIKETSPNRLKDLGVTVTSDIRLSRFALKKREFYVAENTFDLRPGEEIEITLGETIEDAETPMHEASKRLEEALSKFNELLERTREKWIEIQREIPALKCPDERVNNLWRWAWINLELLDRVNANVSLPPNVGWTAISSGGLGPVIYGWDHFYTSMIYVFYRPERVKLIFKLFLSHQRDDGYIPGAIDAYGRDGHFFTQCHALLITTLEHYLGISGDMEFLNEVINGRSVYERLVMAIEWYRRKVKVPVDFEGTRIIHPPKIVETCFTDPEDGLIYTPGMGDAGWDTAEYRGQNNEWVDMNVYLYQALKSMVRICRWMKDENRASEYEEWVERVKESINKLMWNPERGFYFDLDDEHKRMEHVTAAGALPIVTDIPDEEQVDGIIEMLNNPKHLGRPYGIPSLSVSHPMYNPWQYFQRGCCLVIVEIPVILGLYDHGRLDEGFKIWMKIVKRHAKSDGGWRYFGETYNADSGEALWSENYNWSSMEILPVIMSIAGVTVKNGEIRLHPRLPENWGFLEISGLKMLGKRWDIYVTEKEARITPSAT